MIENYDISKTITGVIKKNEVIATAKNGEEARNLILEIPGEDSAFDAGANFGVLVPGPHEFGNPYHFRLYGVAGIEKKNGKTLIDMCVKRCTYVDEFNGEQYKGVASNYLCDSKLEDKIMIVGPFPGPFKIPEDKASNLLLIAQGTGIAPFRGLIQNIYKQHGGWKGKVRLYYGGKTGMELMYMNNQKDDFVNYYDEKTFKAFQAVSPRPFLGEPVNFEQAFEQNSKEIWGMITHANTLVYMAGLKKMKEAIDQAFAKVAGSEEKWESRKAELVAGGRWVELLY
ncbi:MAG: ferredoxin-NADP reductase [SAR324 cluster bacterium]|nr:ferredoxin-NADP reductase [SAR324 cluster bacterium]